MKWHELIQRLVENAGGESAVCRAMGHNGKNFQGTLYKVAHGIVRSPSRATAEKIAAHFKIDVDALYSDAVATTEAQRLGLIAGGPVAAGEPGAAPITKHEPLRRARVMSLAELAAAETLDTFVTVVAQVDLLPYTLAGFDVRINTKATDPAEGALIAVRSSGGACELGICRMTVTGFEVDVGRGVVLDSMRHGLVIRGTAVETARTFRFAI